MSSDTAATRSWTGRLCRGRGLDVAGAEAAAGRGPRHDPGLTFARLSGAVRQTIALESRIAAGEIGTPCRRRIERPHGTGRVDPTLGDPRLQAIRQVLRETADAGTDRATRRILYTEIDERLEELADISRRTPSWRLRS